MRNKKRIILIIIFILLFLLIILFTSFKNEGSVFDFYKQNNNINKEKIIGKDNKKEEKIFEFKNNVIDISNFTDMSDWKEYENKDFGYKLKYPNYWYFLKKEISENEIKSGLLSEEFFSSFKNILSPNDRSRDSSDIPWAMVNFKVLEKNKNLTLKEWVKKYISKRYSNNIIQAQYFKIGNNKIIALLPFKKNSIKTSFIELPDGNVLFIYFTLQVEDKSFSKIFYTIISTLEF